jgi:hypothetical protein
MVKSSLLVFAWLAFPMPASAQASAVVVNGLALSQATVAALQRIYPVPIRPGRYWYDDVSGA